MSRFYSLLPDALKTGQPFALGIISAIKGSSPQKQGAKALFFPDGRIVGTLGGGCLEAEIQNRAQLALLTGTPATFDLVLDHDFGWDDGLICGGKVSGVILPHAPLAADLWRQLAQGDAPLTWGVRKDFTIARVSEAGGVADTVCEFQMHLQPAREGSNRSIAFQDTNRVAIGGVIDFAIIPLSQIQRRTGTAFIADCCGRVIGAQKSH